VRQPGFPDDREWPSLRKHLAPEDWKRIKRLVNRREAAQREDDAYLAVAYARYTIRRMAWSPAWFIPLMLILGYGINLIFYSDLGRALEETVDSSLVTVLFLGLGIPLIQIVKLQRAEQENVDALWRMTTEQREASAGPPTAAARPKTSRR
jgi:hypothetical protein